MSILKTVETIVSLLKIKPKDGTNKKIIIIVGNTTKSTSKVDSIDFSKCLGEGLFVALNISIIYANAKSTPKNIYESNIVISLSKTMILCIVSFAGLQKPIKEANSITVINNKKLQN